MSTSPTSNENFERDCEKAAATRKLIGFYTHQINDYVTVIIGNAEIACDLVPNNLAVRKHLDEIVCAARRIGSAISKLQTLKEE